MHLPIFTLTTKIITQKVFTIVIISDHWNSEPYKFKIKKPKVRILIEFNVSPACALNDQGGFSPVSAYIRGVSTIAKDASLSERIRSISIYFSANNLPSNAVKYLLVLY